MIEIQFSPIDGYCHLCEQAIRGINIVRLGTTLMQRPKIEIICCEPCLLDLKQAIVQSCCVTQYLETPC